MKRPEFLRDNVPLAPLTTLGVGGLARHFADITNETELSEGLAYAEAHGLPLLVMGSGSNLLVADAGFAGVVLRLAVRGVTVQLAGATVFVTAAAGEPWDEFVAHCVAQNWAGLESLSGIPGLTGGTPVQNVGAYGQEVSETIVTVRVYDRLTNSFDSLSNVSCGFAYRQSIFNTTARGRYIVLQVTFALRVDGVPVLRYADLQKYFAEHDAVPTLSEVRQAVLAIRRRKGMVLEATDPDTRSAGSFFKNPLLSLAELAALRAQGIAQDVLVADVAVPQFVAGEHAKVPAAWLIERAGFVKGYARGRAGLSTKHTLALINRGGASSQEIIDLMREIQARVQQCFGVMLEPEPVLVGFASHFASH